MINGCTASPKLSRPDVTDVLTTKSLRKRNQHLRSSVGRVARLLSAQLREFGVSG